MRYIIAGLVLLLTLAACGQSGDAKGSLQAGAMPPEPSEAEPLHIRFPSQIDSAIRNFTLDSTVVSFGTIFSWSNQDGATHTVTSGTPENPTGFWDSGDLSQGESFTFTFVQVGNFSYFCKIHPDIMRGTIRVVGATNNLEAIGKHE